MHQIIIMLLISWLSSCTILSYAVLIVCVPFPYGVWGRMWGSIVSVPDHCFPIYLADLKLFYYIIALGFILGSILKFDNFKK